MAKTIPVINEDKRLEQISEQIVRFANADFHVGLDLSDNRDNIDSIIFGLNFLGEELQMHINEAARREKELKEALFRLNEAQHLARIGSWEWNVPENKIGWTDELYSLYGVDSKTFEANYENYLKFVHPEDRDYVNGIVQKAYEDRQPFDFFHRIIRHDGAIRIHHSRGEVYTDEEGKILKMTGTAQDVTELKESEEKKHTLAAIIESSNDAIISKTLPGIITSWNPRAEVIFGYKEEEVIGKHISILFPEDRVKEEDLIMKNIRSSKALINYETERKRKDGTVFHVAITVSPILDSQKNIIGVSKIARDITEKKYAEERLQKYIRELEYKNKEMQQFSYIASHDLQEPLRTITNFINLFAEDYQGKLDGNADMYIKFISGAATRMQVLVHDLLEYTRIENDSKMEDVDFDSMFKEMIENMKATIDANNVTLKTGALPVVKGFKTHFISLFQNLISNAVKFRKKDEDPVIIVAAEDKGSDWLFTVKDNGIGIEANYYDRIFKLFQRLHTRYEYEGTGIGLAHCKKIVEMRGGSIWIESTVGIGSTFYILLPKKVIV